MSIVHIDHLLLLQEEGRGHPERVPSQSAAIHAIREHRIPKWDPIQFQPIQMCMQGLILILQEEEISSTSEEIKMWEIPPPRPLNDV